LARAADKSHAVLTAINNLDFAMEQMGRTIRVGNSYYCNNGPQPLSAETQDCTLGNGKDTISITDKDNQRITYRLNRTDGSLERENLSITPHRVFNITSPEIRIDSLVFNVIGSSKHDAVQPYVVIRIKGRTAVPTFKDVDQVTFDLQTSVSQRDPDV
jgi:hypothetical protein